MLFRLYMIAIVLFVPLVMILIGQYYLRTDPEKINRFLSFRTAASTRSPEAWEFTHRHLGKLWNRAGMAFIPLSLLAMLFVVRRTERTVAIFSIILCCIQVIIMMGTLLSTLFSLMKNFDRDGVRRGG